MKRTHNETVVGLFVVIGFIMLSAVVFFISGVYAFRSGYTLNILYDYVSILDKGAPVRMAGVRIGEVKQVDLIYSEELKRTRVRVKLFIEKGVQIRQNYGFKIEGTHILSEPHIEITPQPGDEPILSDNYVLEGVSAVSMDEVVAKGHNIVKNLDIILSTLGDSKEDIQSALTHFNQSVQSLSVVLEKVEKGEGTVGKLVSEDELYEEMRAFVAEIKAHPWRLMKKDNGKKFLFF